MTPTQQERQAETSTYMYVIILWGKEGKEAVSATVMMMMMMMMMMDDDDDEGVVHDLFTHLPGFLQWYSCSASTSKLHG